MAKSKTPVAPPRRDPRPLESAPEPAAPPTSHFHMMRETIESIVVAFVLAFLFRTFEAEAFVIPTGSMSPSLLGQHKDVDCSQCGYSFRTTASSEGEERDKLIAQARGARGFEAERLKSYIASLDVVGGMCPMCRNLMPMRADLPLNVKDQVNLHDAQYQPSYPGDRILVNKYKFDFTDPERWDVVVFKFPGDGNMNYIKRLVGLPGETLRIYHGDLFVRPLEANDRDFAILRKPPEKAAAMLQPVHDSSYESSTLFNAGWPLRWAATTPDGWKVEAKAGEKTVSQRFSVDLPADGADAWLRYRHLVPTEDDWRVARAVAEAGSFEELSRTEGVTQQEWQQHIHPQLINDFNPYNARLCRGFAIQDGWEIVPHPGQPNAGSLGSEWVGDLAVECDVKVLEPRGSLALDLVEAGNHFRATIKLDDGKVEMTAVDSRTGQPLNFHATGQSSVVGPGTYSLRLANVDDRLLLWVDDELVDCGDATYDPEVLLAGGRQGMVPWASDDEGLSQGDLSPVGLAARGAKLEVNRLAVLRDIYYIAAKYPGDHYISDYDPVAVDMTTLFSQPDEWRHFAERRYRDFDVKSGQLFVMGDNSPESKDARLWMMGSNDVPGGPYLDRRLLIGKALAVFWPHSWGSIPGLPMLPGFPNFEDMRLVK